MCPAMLGGLNEVRPTHVTDPEHVRWVAANTGADLAEMLGYVPYVGNDRDHGRPRPVTRPAEFTLTR